MKLYIIFAALLAVSLAEDLGKTEDLEALEAQELKVELLRTSREDKESLDTAAATYNNYYVPPSQRPPKQWTTQSNIPAQNQNYIPNIPAQNDWNNQVNVPQNTNFNTPVTTPQNNYPGQNQNYIPSVTAQNDYQQSIVPPSNYYPSNPQNTFSQSPYPQNIIPQNTIPQNIIPQNTIPQNNFPQNTWPQNVAQQKPQTPQNDAQQEPQAPQNDAQQNPQNDLYYPAVIKNEQYFGENGNYKYEYQIADGTHVSEQGWLTNPNTDNESVVKKGWYSYTGADGRVYTVTWWADDSGYHAFGDHLPTPPPVPAAIQAALDQAAKEEAEKNKPVYYPTTPVYYPTTQAPVYYPNQPVYHPQQTYPQQQNPHYPQQQNPQYPQQQYPKPGHYGK